MNMNFYTPFDNSQISLGQFKDQAAFNGKLTNMILFLNPLGEQEIRSLADNYDIEEILRKTSFNESIVSYMNESKVPATSFTGLTVAEGFLDRVEQAEAGGAEEPPLQMHAKDILEEYFNYEGSQEMRNKVVASIQPGKYEYLMKVCALMTSPEGSFDGHIEVDRLKLALSYLRVPISADELFNLAEISKLSKTEVDEDKSKTRYIHFHPFLRALRRSIPEINITFQEAKALGFGQSPKKQQDDGDFNDLESDCSDEIDEAVVGAQKDQYAKAYKEA